MAPLSMAQDWLVPAEEAAKTNPQAYTLENVKSGKAIYTLNCKSCHGDPGKNNPLALVPLPVDISSERMQANNEGQLFYKISNGKGVMPPFQSDPFGEGPLEPGQFHHELQSRSGGALD